MISDKANPILCLSWSLALAMIVHWARRRLLCAGEPRMLSKAFSCAPLRGKSASGCDHDPEASESNAEISRDAQLGQFWGASG